jgi:hypothetical protein
MVAPIDGDHGPIGRKVRRNPPIRQSPEPFTTTAWLDIPAISQIPLPALAPGWPGNGRNIGKPGKENRKIIRSTWIASYRMAIEEPQQ